MTVQQEVGDRLDAIERWVVHARKAECAPGMALGAIEALALAGLQHSDPRTAGASNVRAVECEQTVSGPGGVVSAQPGPWPATSRKADSPMTNPTPVVKSKARQR